MAPTGKRNDTWSWKGEKAAVQRTSEGLEGKEQGEGGSDEFRLPNWPRPYIVSAVASARGRPCVSIAAECVPREMAENVEQI